MSLTFLLKEKTGRLEGGKTVDTPNGVKMREICTDLIDSSQIDPKLVRDVLRCNCEKPRDVQSESYENTVGATSFSEDSMKAESLVEAV